LVWLQLAAWSSVVVAATIGAMAAYALVVPAPREVADGMAKQVALLPR
jgi:hypothetical protein